MPNAEQFQAELHQYVPIFTVNHWPTWLMLAFMALVAMLAVLGFHALLRAMLIKKTPSNHETKLYLYSRGVRVWHWSNALLFILLLISGFANHFSLVSAETTVSLVFLHKVCGIFLVVCWLGFVAVNIFGGNGHHYKIKSEGWLHRCCIQTRYYLFGIMKGEDHPIPVTQESKFNPLQQLAYLGVMLGLVPLLIITGLLSLNPEWLVSIGLANLKSCILLVHLALAVMSLFFVFGHLYLCTIAGRTPLEGFKSMIDGFHRH